MSEENKEAPAKGEGDVEKIAKAVEGLLAKHGDPNAALRVLLNENHGYRDRLRDVSAKLPPEGAVVLAGDDAAEWGKFRGLGKFSDVRRQVDEGKAASAKLSDIERTKELESLGKLAGMNPVVFARLARTDGLEFETKEEKGQDGRAVERVFVKGEDGRLTPADDHAKAHWPEFLPALRGDGKAEPAKPVGTPRPNAFHQPPPRPGKAEDDDPYRDAPTAYVPPPM